MTSLSVNDMLSSLDGTCTGRLAFVASGRSRRTYGVCSRELTGKIVSGGQFSYGSGHIAKAFQGRSPLTGPAATKFVGAFEFDYGQEFNLEKVPLETASSFEALGEMLTVLGMRDGPHLCLEAINVTLRAPGSDHLVSGFLEFSPSSRDVELPFDGALVVDKRGRGVGILVGRSSERFFAVGIEDCLKALDLEPLGTDQHLQTAPMELQGGIDAEVQQSMRAAFEHQPTGQLAEIMKEELLEMDHA